MIAQRLFSREKWPGTRSTDLVFNFFGGFKNLLRESVCGTGAKIAFAGVPFFTRAGQ